MVDGLTSRGTSGSGASSKIPFLSGSGSAGNTQGAEGSNGQRPYDAPSFGRNSYGSKKGSNPSRTSQSSPNKKPGAETSRLGAKAPQSIDGLSDPGSMAMMQGKAPTPSAEGEVGEETQAPEEATQENPEGETPAEGAGEEGAPEASSAPAEGGESSEASDSAGDGEAEGAASSSPTLADQVATANNLQRSKDASSNSGPDLGSDALDSISENPVELLEAAEGNKGEKWKKFKEQAVELLKKYIKREIIIPFLLSLLPNCLVAAGMIIAAVILLFLIGSISGKIPGLDSLITLVSNFL